MPPNAHLVSLLSALQTSPSLSPTTRDAPRLLSSSAYLLTQLSNPLNISLLTSQLLHAPAIWSESTKLDLRFCVRFMGVFQSAAVELRRRNEKQDGTHGGTERQDTRSEPERTYTRLSMEEWIAAVVKGANGKIAMAVLAWREALVLGGLLLAFRDAEGEVLCRRSRKLITSVLVEKINAATQGVIAMDDFAGSALGLVLNYTFGLLEEREKAALDWDCLVGILYGAAFTSQEGYYHGRFLSSIDQDVKQVAESQFGWSDRSPSFSILSDLVSQPLVAGMGPFARIIAYGIGRLREPRHIKEMMEDLVIFSSSLKEAWRQLKLSEVDAAEEKLFLDRATVTTTLPLLWKLMSSCHFATVIILSAVLGRTLSDSKLAADRVAPILAYQALDILRSQYFITLRLGSNAFTQHTFIHLSAIDILSYHQALAIGFLTDIHPLSSTPTESNGRIPNHPLDRILNLYFLNTAEHFSHILPSEQASSLLLTAAEPYLHPPKVLSETQRTGLLDLFEAAHSLYLAVLSSPRGISLAPTHLPKYIDILFSVFPESLSARQFTLAFKTLVEISSPPNAIARLQPEMLETLMYLLQERILATPHGIAMPAHHQHQFHLENHEHKPAASLQPETSDLRTSLVLTMISTLPLLPISLLDIYLSEVARLIGTLPARSPSQKTCQEALWRVLSSGDMDVERSQFAVAWWTTRGGREIVMGLSDTSGRDRYMMSGAIDGGNPGQSKL